MSNANLASMASGSGPFRRILKLEPGISLGWWLYERVANNWERLVAIFVGAGGMAYLASITDWVSAWGATGIGATGISFAMLIWLVLSWTGLMKAKTHELRVRANMQAQWAKTTDRVNPAAREFREQRINLADLVVPGDMKVVRNKTFIGCEIIGPTNIIFWKDFNLGGSRQLGCDAVVLQLEDAGRRIWTGIWIENCQFVNCTFYGVTFFFHILQYPHAARIGYNWISLLPNQDTTLFRNVPTGAASDLKEDTALAQGGR
ncbi:hypothetical protein [Microvirga sp. P5_D2]